MCHIARADQGGHAIYGMKTNACGNDAATNYLANGTFPQQDISCPAEAPAAALLSTGKAQAVKEVLRRIRPLR